jgi:hypothetical protein
MVEKPVNSHASTLCCLCQGDAGVCSQGAWRSGMLLNLLLADANLPTQVLFCALML